MPKVSWKDIFEGSQHTILKIILISLKKRWTEYYLMRNCSAHRWMTCLGGIGVGVNCEYLNEFYMVNFSQAPRVSSFMTRKEESNLVKFYKI